MGDRLHEDEETYDPEILAKARAIFAVEARRKAALEAEPYDGILGQPPEWVPLPTLKQFTEARHWLLDKHHWPPERIVYFLDTYGKDEMMGWFGFRLNPLGRPMDQDAFHDRIGFLANLRWAVSLRPEDGLQELAGKTAVRGYQMEQGPRKPRQDALLKAMNAALDRLTGTNPKKAPTCLDLLKELDPKHSEQGEIQEIDWDGEAVYWRTRNSQEKCTKFKTFQNRYSRMKKFRV